MTDKTEAQPEALRLRKYIDRRRASRGLDPEHIHGFDAGDDAETLLLTSDLEALLGRIASLEAQLSARQAAPDGWKLVPMVPTDAMQTACKSVVDLEQGDPDDHRYDDGRTTVNAIYVAMLSAAPPPPERETLPPDFPVARLNSPACWCETCDTTANSGLRSRMSLCPDCGNKRCPKATHHDNACTNSNAPGQPGSSWEHVKPHGATNDNP